MTMQVLFWPKDHVFSMAFFGKVKPNESGRRESQHQKYPQVSFQKRKIAWSTRWRWKTDVGH